MWLKPDRLYELSCLAHWMAGDPHLMLPKLRPNKKEKEKKSTIRQYGNLTARTTMMTITTPHDEPPSGCFLKGCQGGNRRRQNRWERLRPILLPVSAPYKGRMTAVCSKLTETSYRELPPARGSRAVDGSRELWRDLSSFDLLLPTMYCMFTPPQGMPDRSLDDCSWAGSAVT